VIDTGGVEGARSADNAVDVIILLQKEFRQVGSVLPRYSRD
jgi:hypothetical protein